MESGSFLLLRRDGVVGEVFVDKLFPAGQFFIAPIQPEIHGKTHRATDIMAGHRIVREGIRVVTMVVMTVHIVEKTAHMLAQGVIENQARVSLRTADRLRLLEQIREPTVVDLLLEPGRLGEEAGEVGFVSTLQHAAGDVRQAFVVEDDQACQVILKMLKLAPILEEVSKNIGMSGHEGSGSYDWKLHQALTLSRGGWDKAREYHTEVGNGKTQQWSCLPWRVVP